MKYYVDIILQGKEFNPEEVSNILGIKFRKFHKSGDYNERLKCNEIEGYGILSSREELTTEEERMVSNSSFSLVFNSLVLLFFKFLII